MKIFQLSLLLNLCFASIVYGQKRSLDYAASSTWAVIQSQIITDDGKFLAYGTATPNGDSMLYIVREIEGQWKREFSGTVDGIFTSDSKRLIYRNQNDSLCVVELGTENIFCIPRIGKFTIPEEGNGQWLFYQAKDSTNVLVTLDLYSHKETRYRNIQDHIVSKDGRSLVLQVGAANGSAKADLLWLDLGNQTSSVIYRDCRAKNLILDNAGTQLAFFDSDPSSANHNLLHLYDKTKGTLRTLVDSSTPGMKGIILSDEVIRFSNRGDKILFNISNLNKSEDIAIQATGASVSILGAPEEDNGAHGSTEGVFPAIMYLNGEIGDKIIRLQQETEVGKPIFLDNDFNWALTESNSVGDYADYKWNKLVRPDLYIISTKDGSRRLLKKRLIYAHNSFSPSGKYVIWFDRGLKQWVCHNNKLNITKNITQSIKNRIYQDNEYPDFPLDEGLAGWLQDDSGILIYDHYDIWKVDPDGINRPINLTQGYGFKNKIQFRYINFNDDSKYIGLNDTLLLSAFNVKTKNDGFFHLIINGLKLEKLVQSPCVYTYQSPSFCGSFFPLPLEKAKNRNLYFGAKMAPNEYPNLFVTSNFKHLTPVTNFAPQKPYNWYSTELIHWRQKDGSPCEGILYKPENFDPRKKYPIIFFYYEQYSNALNGFIYPDLSNGAINIPWFVSNGYLVLVPDIHYKIGYPGKSAYNTVVSAADYLKKMPWVDSRRMGLQGHSFGGFETNYIVAHTSEFAAAAPAAGSSNDADLYSDPNSFGTWYYERRQGRIGAALWERPDLYIENSPIFNVSRISTPLLIMQNKNDEATPYNQGLQFYTALHRLHKKVWMLSYEKGRHNLDDPGDQKDYSIRLAQFFDHYLKGKPAPLWMTEGGTNLELDTSGRKPRE